MTPQKSTRDWDELDMVGYGCLIQGEIELKGVKLGMEVSRTEMELADVILDLGSDDDHEM